MAQHGYDVGCILVTMHFSCFFHIGAHYSSTILAWRWASVGKQSKYSILPQLRIENFQGTAPPCPYCAQKDSEKHEGAEHKCNKNNYPKGKWPADGSDCREQWQTPSPLRCTGTATPTVPVQHCAFLQTSSDASSPVKFHRAALGTTMKHPANSGLLWTADPHASAMSWRNSRPLPYELLSVLPVIEPPFLLLSDLADVSNPLLSVESILQFCASYIWFFRQLSAVQKKDEKQSKLIAFEGKRVLQHSYYASRNLSEEIHCLFKTLRINTGQYLDRLKSSLAELHFGCCYGKQPSVISVRVHSRDALRP